MVTGLQYLISNVSMPHSWQVQEMDICQVQPESQSTSSIVSLLSLSWWVFLFWYSIVVAGDHVLDQSQLPVRVVCLVQVSLLRMIWCLRRQIVTVVSVAGRLWYILPRLVSTVCPMVKCYSLLQWVPTLSDHSPPQPTLLNHSPTQHNQLHFPTITGRGKIKLSPPEHLFSSSSTVPCIRRRFRCHMALNQS